MEKLFNSTFENSLRLLMLLNEYDLPQTLDMLYAVDFMTSYAKTFGLAENNLNGDNDYKFSEFASQRELIRDALKELVLNGVAEAVNYKEGLSYIITPEGEAYCASLDSDYAAEYKKCASTVIKSVEGETERSLIANIYKMSGQSLHKEIV